MKSDIVVRWSVVFDTIEYICSASGEYGRWPNIKKCVGNEFNDVTQIEFALSLAAN
ncbi:MAG: hypothetical protein ACNYNY_03350 [Candidatus Oxydemutatoraceae bacterium WSBS_2016_MAG_OTU14]